MPAALLAQTPTSPCGPPEEATALCDALYRATGNELMARAGDVLIVRPAKVVLIIVVAFVVTRLVRRLISRFVAGVHGERVQRRLRLCQERAPGVTVPADSARAGRRAETIGDLLRSVASFSVWVVAALMILGELGLQLGPLIAGAGIVGVALGFGAQNLVRDFLSGIFMLLEDQYGVGDVIDAGPASGVVEAVTLRTTRLRDVNGDVWHIPNGNIERVANKSQQWSRALLDVPVPYSADTGAAIDVIKEVADAAWRDPDWSTRITAEPEVWGVEDLGREGMAIRLVVQTLPRAQWDVARELRARIKAGFDAEGIEIPVPQRVIWNQEDAPVRS